MQEKDRWVGACHVMVNGNDINAVGTQCFQDRCDLRFQHGNIPCDDRLSITAVECGPRVQAHSSIDRCPHFFQREIGTPDRDLVYGSVLLSFGADNLGDLSGIEFSFK
jgi:hypothetical protein